MLEAVNPAKSGAYALRGFLFGLLLVVLSLLSVRLGRYFSAEFTLIPLAAIFLWPRHASLPSSPIYIFSIGLLVDITSGGPLGLWALTYLIMFGAFRPDLQAHDAGLWSTWMRFGLWLLLSHAIILVLAVLFVDGRTAFLPMISQIIMAALLFPIVFYLYLGVETLVRDPDETG